MGIYKNLIFNIIRHSTALISSVACIACNWLSGKTHYKEQLSFSI